MLTGHESNTIGFDTGINRHTLCLAVEVFLRLRDSFSGPMFSVKDTLTALLACDTVATSVLTAFRPDIADTVSEYGEMLRKSKLKHYTLPSWLLTGYPRADIKKSLSASQIHFWNSEKMLQPDLLVIERGIKTIPMLKKYGIKSSCPRVYIHLPEYIFIAAPHCSCAVHLQARTTLKQYFLKWNSASFI